LTGVRKALSSEGGCGTGLASDCILNDIDMAVDVNPLSRVREEFNRQKKTTGLFP